MNAPFHFALGIHDVMKRNMNVTSRVVVSALQRRAREDHRPAGHGRIDLPKNGEVALVSPMYAHWKYDGSHEARKVVARLDGVA